MTGSWKFCVKCLVSYKLEDYHRDGKTKDGRVAICKLCSSRAHKKRYAIVRDQKIRYQREYQRTHAEELGRKAQERHQLHPEVRKNYTAGKGRWFNARATAAPKGRAWGVSRIDFDKLIRQPCHYCGGPLDPTGKGLDRIENSKGYTLDNVVPCCGDCNRTRMDIYTYDEMLMLAKTIRLIKSMRNVD